MATMLGIDNSIGWAHWQLRGAWKGMLGAGGIFVGLITGAILISLQASPGRQADVLAFWSKTLLVVQVAILLVWAVSRVASAIHSDINTRMIESHRLMPVPAVVAISGYLWGPPAQALSVAVANLLIGCVIMRAAGVELIAWIAPNLVLASFALFGAVVSALTAMLSKHGIALLLVLIMLLGYSYGLPLLFLPALCVLATPLHGRSIFVTSISSADLGWGLMAGTVAQACLGAIFYWGAARTYRQTEALALAVVPALLLLACWVCISALGIVRWSDFEPGFLDIVGRHLDDYRLPIVFITSLLSAMLLSLVPIANAARRRNRPAFAFLVACAAASIAAVLCVVMHSQSKHWPRSFAITVMILLAFSISMSYMLRIMYRATDRGWIVPTMWIAITWLGPVVGDGVRWAMADFEGDFALSWIGAISPLGAIILCWNDLHGDLAIGLMIQSGYAIAWAALYYLTGRHSAVAEPTAGEIA